MRRRARQDRRAARLLPALAFVAAWLGPEAHAHAVFVSHSVAWTVADPAGAPLDVTFRVETLSNNGAGSMARRRPSGSSRSRR